MKILRLELIAKTTKIFEHPQEMHSMCCESIRNWERTYKIQQFLNITLDSGDIGV